MCLLGYEEVSSWPLTLPMATHIDALAVNVVCLYKLDGMIMYTVYMTLTSRAAGASYRLSTCIHASI